MPDRDEAPVDRHLSGCVADRVGYLEPGQPGFPRPDELADGRVPGELDLRIRPCAILEDLAGAELIAPVDHRDLTRELGQEKALLDRGVATAHDRDLLLPEERRVARGARRDAEPAQFTLVRYPELSRHRARCHDQGVAGAFRGILEGDSKGPIREVHGARVAADEVGTETLRLGLHAVDELGSLDPLREAREVLDVGGRVELAAELATLDDDRFQVRTGRVDRRGQSRGSRAQDDQPVMVIGQRFLLLIVGPRFAPQQGCEAAGRVQRRELLVATQVDVADEDLGCGKAPAGPLYHLLQQLGATGDADLLVRDAVPLEKRLGPHTERAERLRVDDSLRHRCSLSLLSNPEAARAAEGSPRCVVLVAACGTGPHSASDAIVPRRYGAAGSRRRPETGARRLLQSPRSWPAARQSRACSRHGRQLSGERTDDG